MNIIIVKSETDIPTEQGNYEVHLKDGNVFIWELQNTNINDWLDKVIWYIPLKEDNDIKVLRDVINHILVHDTNHAYILCPLIVRFEEAIIKKYKLE
jgi:hypothetical protein